MAGGVSATPPRRRAGRLGWRLAVPVVLICAGGLFATSAGAARGTDLRGGQRTDLAELIRSEGRRVASANRLVTRLREQVAAQTDAVAGRDERVGTLQRRVARLADPAGLTPVTGPGVTVSLDDAPARAAGQTLPAETSPDDLIVHQQDVQAVVNALWAGGAEAMRLMDQRVISTSAVRCVGNTLILQGRVYSPPYRVTAIGDPQRLVAALDRSEQVSVYRQYVDQVGLVYAVEQHRSVTLPAYSGALDLVHARAVDQ